MLQVGKPVTGNNLIGRDDEIKLLIELLKSGQSIVIIAPRRMGKTSLVLELIAKFKEQGFYTAYTDLFSTPSIPRLAFQITESILANKKFDTAFRKTLNNISEVIQNIQFRQEIEDYSFIIDFKNKSNNDKWEVLENSIDFIETYAEKNKKHIIAAFDEFGDIKKLDGKEIVKLFRSKVQMQKSVSYIFSGSYESVMQELFVEKNAPFFRMARIINLGNIKEEAFSSYLKSLFKREKISINEERISQLLSFSKGHPYYTQLYAQELIIQYKISSNQNLLTHNEMLEHLLIVEKNYLEKSWDELSKSTESRKVLTFLAAGEKNLYSKLNDRKINIPRALKKLRGLGIIYSSKKQYHFSDPLLQHWINHTINIEFEI